MATNSEDIVHEEFNSIHFHSGPVYKEMHLKQAQIQLKQDELQSIYHLTESHCPAFRYRASVLYEKSVRDATHNVLPMIRDNFAVKCSNTETSAEVQDMLDKVEELPKEWTLIQLTPAFNLDQSLEIRPKRLYTNPLHLTVFNCGQNEIQPVTVCVDAPRDNEGSIIQVVQEIDKIIAEIKDGCLRYKDLTTARIKETYAQFRTRLNDGMKGLVNVVQKRWLREWRILLIGKFVDRAIEDEIDKNLERILEEVGITSKIEKKSKVLLRYVLKGHPYLDLMDIMTAVRLCLPEVDRNEQISVVQLIRNTSFNHQKRHPVILIVDDYIDLVPWEMIDILMDQPVSRMQSFHFTYALYKEHENEIVDGWKVNVDPAKGTYLLNPGLDLVQMQNRLSSFYSYWMPGWKNIVGRTPDSAEFLDLVTSGDIFCYNGHSDGFQFITSNNLQKLRINAVVFMFGCGSVQLKNIGPQCEYFGSHQNYITACSPCVVGMLWTVTDTDTDLLSTEFLSRWIPAHVPTHWKNLNKKKWESGEIEIPITKLPKSNQQPGEHEPELLTALHKSKQGARQYLTKAACVARGIPVRISPLPPHTQPRAQKTHL